MNYEEYSAVYTLALEQQIIVAGAYGRSCWRVSAKLLRSMIAEETVTLGYLHSLKGSAVQLKDQWHLSTCHRWVHLSRLATFPSPNTTTVQVERLVSSCYRRLRGRLEFLHSYFRVTSTGNTHLGVIYWKPECQSQPEEAREAGCSGAQDMLRTKVPDDVYGTIIIKFVARVQRSNLVCHQKFRKKILFFLKSTLASAKL